MQHAYARTAGIGTTKKILLSLGAVGAATSVAGLGTFATFSDTESGSTPIDSGIVAMTIGASGAANRLAVAATDLVPGDTVQRAVHLTVDPSTTSTPASITLSTSAAPSNLLTTDTENGLQMAITACSVPWTESGSSPAFTYTCAGSESTVVASRPVAGSDLALANLALAAGSTNHLRVTVTLPTTAGNSFQDLSTTVSYAFTANQRAATNK